MIFNILSSKVSYSRWQDRDTTVSITYDVEPRGRAYLDIGDRYVLAAARYPPMRDKNRQPVECTVTITCDPENISHLKTKTPICGYAQFYPERNGSLDDDPPKLLITLVTDATRFAELLNLRITQPGTATLNAQIDDLEFGWEPDGSHQIWKLPEVTDKFQRDRRHIDSFWIAVETFWTSEGAVGQPEDERTSALLAESPDETDRKLAAINHPVTSPDTSANLLGHIRTLLTVLVVLLFGMLLKLT